MRYDPKVNFSIDKQMVGTHCTISFIQDMAKKQTKFGIKLWVLCETDKGDCLKFGIYTGKLDQGQKHGLAHCVIIDLMADFLDKNHHLYFDNFNSTVKLFQDFQQRHAYACVNIRSYRGGFPADYKENLQQDESQFLRVEN